MKIIISQEAFNETVKENITDLEMTPEEALQETIEQYEAQGVDLGNIVQTIEMVQGQDPVKKLKDDLQSYSLNTSDMKTQEEIITVLVAIRKLCTSNIAYKMLAGTHGIHEVVFRLLTHTPPFGDLLNDSCLETLIALMDGYPDLLGDEEMTYMMDSLNNETSHNKIQLVLQWIRITCIMHETNRQKFFSRGIMEALKKFIKADMNPAVLKAACGVMFAMTLNDDIRALIPSFHAHASAFAMEYLQSLVAILTSVKDEDILSDVVNTMCALIVRDEFCQLVSTDGGVLTIMNMLDKYKDNKTLIKRLVNLLTSLAGNDNVKDEIMKLGAAERIVQLLTANVGSSNFASAVLLLISKLSLRVQKHGLAFIKAGCIPTVLQAMAIHELCTSVQRNGCWALRNIASHNKEQRDVFLNLEVEAIMNRIISGNKDVADDATAVLISLGCSAKLTERWTGEQGDKLAA